MTGNEPDGLLSLVAVENLHGSLWILCHHDDHCVSTGIIFKKNKLDMLNTCMNTQNIHIQVSCLEQDTCIE